jgi:hypothetical protein
VLVHEDDLRGVDTGEIGAAGGDDGVEVLLRSLDDLCPALAGARRLRRIRLHDDDIPAGELERPRVDASEAELQHPAGPFSEQLEDPRRCGRGQSRRKSVHRYARYMNVKHTGKFLGVPYDWRRPTWERYMSRWWNTKDRRIVMPRAFGWGYDFNLAEVARRLHLRG